MSDNFVDSWIQIHIANYHSLSYDSALASHKKYGLKESDEYYDLGDEATFNDLFEFFNNDNAALAPGVIRIPVCSPDDAFDGWKRKTVGQKLWPSYPCGKLSETRMLGKH